MNAEFFQELDRIIRGLKDWFEKYGPVTWFQNFDEVKDNDFKRIWVTTGNGDEYLTPLDPKVFGKWLVNKDLNKVWVEGNRDILSDSDFELEAQFCLTSIDWSTEETLHPVMRWQPECPNCNHDESEIDSDDCEKCDGQGSLDIQAHVLEQLIPFSGATTLRKNFFKVYSAEN